MQKNTSATTSLNQINPLIKNLLPYLSGYTILDIGGGKFQANKQHAEQLKINYHVYDKYNRSPQENAQALACRPQLILCNNVLNVIDEGQALRNTIALCAAYQVPCYFTIYEGNKSGIAQTSKTGCWQRNWKTQLYIPVLKRFFTQVEQKHNLLICRN